MKARVILICSIVLVSLVICIYLFLCFNNFFYPLKFKDNIEVYSNLYDVSNYKIASVINAESRFNEYAISGKGAMGLMQLLPETANWLANKLNIEYSEKKLMEPDYNIKLGTYYLKYLSDKFDNFDAVLAAYNAGEGVVRLWLSDTKFSSDGKSLQNIPYPETQNYILRVNRGMEVYIKKFQTERK